MNMRKIIKKLHLYIALVLCLPLVIQGLLGSILVFQHELSHKEYVLVQGEKKPLSEIISAASAKVEDGFKSGSVRFDGAASIRFSKKVEGERSLMKEVVIDPVSLEILEVKNPQDSILNLIKRFHESLLIKGEIGKNIVGIYGFVLLFMTISGIIIWWPRSGMWKRAITFKFSDSGKKFHRDLHGAVGFWISILLLITSFSGVYLIYPKGTSSFIAAIFPARDLRESPKANPQNGKVLTIDQALEVAGEKNLLSVMLPTKPDQAYRFNFESENYREGKPVIVVFVDQYLGKILEKRDPKDYSIGETITVWMHSLHEGAGFGIIYQIAVCLVGLSILLFSITGVSLWWIKRKAKRLSLGLPA
jgi:uncharacterized iron-regulated membrane protein